MMNIDELQSIVTAIKSARERELAIRKHANALGWHLRERRGIELRRPGEGRALRFDGWIHAYAFLRGGHAYVSLCGVGNE